MKNLDVRNLLNKARTGIITAATLAFVTMTTLTGCTIDLGGVNLDEIDNKDELVETIAVFIDEQEDLTDEETLNTVKDTLTQLIDENFSDNTEFEKAALVRVVDGDTIVVKIDKEKAKVRLIGIDTPESVASDEYLKRTGKENTEAGKKASEYTKELLEDVDYVYLQKDTSDTDRYGRLLRYVWLEVPADDHNIEEIATKMLNGILIRDGYANIATYKPDTEHKDDFEYIFDNYEEFLRE